MQCFYKADCTSVWFLYDCLSIIFTEDYIKRNVCARSNNFWLLITLASVDEFFYEQWRKSIPMIAQMQIMLSTKSKWISVLPQDGKWSGHIFLINPKQKIWMNFGTLIVLFFSQRNQGKQTTSHWKKTRHLSKTKLDSKYFLQLFYSCRWCSSIDKWGGLWNWFQYLSKRSVYTNLPFFGNNTKFRFCTY